MERANTVEYWTVGIITQGDGCIELRHSYLGLSEMRWTGKREMNGGEVIWSGEEKSHTKGVGFLLSKRARTALLSYTAVNSKIIATRFRGAPPNLAVVQAYIPTTDSTDEEIEKFYEDLEKELNELPNKDIKVVVGD